jgi:magnesium chelatase family protein
MNCATALGTYLVGLSARTIAITATTLPTSDLQFDLPKERGKTIDSWAAWERETNVRVRCTFNLLGIDTGFSISFDHIPPFGPHVDLAILAACLGAIGKLPSAWFADRNFDGCKIFLGELDFHGRICPVRGVLPTIFDLCKTRSEADERSFVVPYDNTIEASHVDTGTSVFVVAHISELFNLHEHTVARTEYREPKSINHIGPCLSKLPKRVVDAIERAAVERKSIHLVGSNADRAVRLLRSILPPMTKDEAIESAKLLSIGGLLRPDAIGQHSYRAPHHTIEPRGLVGGDFPPRAGEVSLAHNGLLYLPDLPQFKRGAIEVLAPVLREGKASLWRRAIRVEFPAKTMLVTSATRCPCERPSVEHSDYCAERADRKSDPTRDEFYLGWQKRFTKELGIETIVDTDFGPNDEACTDTIEVIRDRVQGTKKDSTR